MKQVDKTSVLIVFGVIIAIVQLFLREYPYLRIISGITVFLIEFIIWHRIQELKKEALLLLSDLDHVPNVYIDLLSEEEEVTESFEVEEKDALAIYSYFKGKKCRKDRDIAFERCNCRLRIVSEEGDVVLYLYLDRFDKVRVGQETAYIFTEEESEDIYDIVKKYVQ